jgi:hypothetical protein
MAVTGLAGIDDCAAPAVCPFYCGGNCFSDSWYCAWPNYFACTDHDCTVQSDKPRGGGCNSTIWFTTPCLSGTEYGGSIFECGPCPGQWRTTGACNDGTNLEIIACVTSALFTQLCNGCNPWAWGLVRITAHP